MLQRTFCHVPGIGPRTEQALWAAGIDGWDAAVSRALPLSGSRADKLRRGAEEAAAQLTSLNAKYFHERLPAREQWRLFGEFQDATAYLDIETTGMGGWDDYITTITVYDGRTLRHYIHDQNITRFREDILDYKLIVTYNGKCFDLPMIRRLLGAPMEQAHVDLRYPLASLGYKGGLKGCERALLGTDRKELTDVDGYFAVLLWQDFIRRDNRKALETLLAYNTLDTVNLAALMVAAYNRKLESTPFAAALRLPMPALPENPFKADAATIARLRGRFTPGVAS